MCVRLQLRQHSFMKHGDRSPRWIDTTSGKLSADQSALTIATLPAGQASPLPVRPRKPTARKSTSQGGIRVSMFRCGDFFSIRQCSTAVREYSAANEYSPAASGASVDSGISQSDSVEHTSQPVVCCHLCPFAANSVSSFADHLQVVHQWPASRRIQILAPDDPDTPRRCGFCPYEGLSDAEFSQHVSAVHGMSAPLLCSVCRVYAAFRVGEIRRHFVGEHLGFSTAEWEPLSGPYSVCRELQCPRSAGGEVSCMLSPAVRVADIADMSQVEFSNLLDASAVWFDY